MSPLLPWTLFALGLGHLLFGAIRFRHPLRDALADGFIGKFGEPEVRRSALWFMLFGPLLMLAGQVAIHAVSINDAYLVRLVGFYLLAVSAIGALALPKSPFLAALVIALLHVALGYGLV